MSIKNVIILAAIPALLVGCGDRKGSENTQSNQEAYGTPSKVAELGAANSLSSSSFVPDRIFFDFDSSKLSEDSKDALKLQAELVKTSGQKIIVEGHADERGTDAYNLALGLQRAKSAKSQLVSYGVKSENIKIVTFGKNKIEVPGDNEEAHAKNRRSVTVLVH